MHAHMHTRATVRRCRGSQPSWWHGWPTVTASLRCTCGGAQAERLRCAVPHLRRDRPTSAPRLPGGCSRLPPYCRRTARRTPSASVLGWDCCVQLSASAPPSASPARAAREWTESACAALRGLLPPSKAARMRLRWPRVHIGGHAARAHAPPARTRARTHSEDARVPPRVFAARTAVGPLSVCRVVCPGDRHRRNRAVSAGAA